MNSYDVNVLGTCPAGLQMAKAVGEGCVAGLAAGAQVKRLRSAAQYLIGTGVLECWGLP